MKSIITLTLATLLVLLGGPVGAQTYDGTSLEEGIFYTPADVGPGSSINFAVSNLMANSDVTFELLNSSSQPVDGLEVAGAVVLRTDSVGNLNADIRLPSTVGAGVLTLNVSGTNADGSVYTSSLAITVTDAAAANTAAQTEPASLALTGSNSNTRILGGIVLVVLGAGLVTLASQRRRTETSAV